MIVKTNRIILINTGVRNRVRTFNARRPNGLRKKHGGCRIPTEPFSPNGLKCGWHRIPKNPLSPKGLKCGWHNIPLNQLSPKGLKRGWHNILPNSLSLRAEMQMAPNPARALLS